MSELFNSAVHFAITAVTVVVGAVVVLILAYFLSRVASVAYFRTKFDFIGKAMRMSQKNTDKKNDKEGFPHA